jgi:hypothetical protein
MGEVFDMYINLFLLLLTYTASDLFDVVQEPSLIPNQTSKSGSYISQGTRELPYDREDDCNIEDICGMFEVYLTTFPLYLNNIRKDFVVEYIHSDIVVSTTVDLNWLNETESKDKLGPCS